MILDLSKFKKDFLAANLLPIIQKDFEVILIWRAGSTLTGLADSDSDIDLGVLIAGEILPSRNEDYLIYKPTNTKVQWIYDTVQDITTLQPHANQRNIGWAQFGCLKNIQDEAIFYINPKYYTFISHLMQQRQLIAEYSMWLYYRDKEALIKQILKSGMISTECQVKSLYHLCWSCDILLGEPSDRPFLKALRKIKTHPVSEEYLTKAFQRIQQLDKYFSRQLPLKPDLISILHNERGN